MLASAEGVAPVLGRSVNDWPPLHVNSVGQLLVAFDAPRIRMTRANLRVALRAFADYRWRFIDCRTSRGCIHKENFNPSQLLVC